MPKKKPSNHAISSSNSSDFSRINQELYKRNFDLAIRNKAFSLLKELYDISLVTLNDQQLGKKLVHTIQQGLSAEIVGLFFFDHKLDSKKRSQLMPIAMAFSKRVQKLAAPLTKDLLNIVIPVSCVNNICSQAISERQVKIISKLADARQLIQDKNLLQQSSQLTHIHSVIICPLVNDRRVLGALIIASARQQKDFSNFELEVINNFTTIITVALDKALMYKELRQNAEKMKVLYEMKSNFLTIASHQLRTPVSIIRGMLSMMNEEGMTDAEKLALAPQAYNAANNLEHIIHDILTATEIDASKLRTRAESVDLLPIIDAVITTLAPKAKKKGLEIIYKKPRTSGTPGAATQGGAKGVNVQGAKAKSKSKFPRVLVESTKIQEALANLVDNALNYTEKGHVEINVSQQTAAAGNPVPANKKYLVFAVTDTGIGMTAEDKKQLTEKFYRGKRALSMHPNGSGLGLFISRGIAESSGGKLEFTSPGRDAGSTFRLLLPIVE